MGEAWSCQRLVSRNSFRRATIIYRGRSRLYIIGVGKLGSLVIDSLLAWDSNEQLPGKSSFERKKEISIESAINRSSRVRGGSKRFRRKICTFWRISIVAFLSSINAPCWMKYLSIPECLESKWILVIWHIRILILLLLLFGCIYIYIHICKDLNEWIYYFVIAKEFWLCNERRSLNNSYEM